MKHYYLNEEGDHYTDRSFTMNEDRGNELVSFTAGWLGLSLGWYVQVSKRGLCVVEFGASKRSALRYARRAWRKEWNKISTNEKGYPKVVDCED